jgi:hypothetical protein
MARFGGLPTRIRIKPHSSKRFWTKYSIASAAYGLRMSMSSVGIRRVNAPVFAA